MPTRPAVPGLVKHQLMFSQGALETSVTTIWTYLAADPPSGARIAAEQAAVLAWTTGNWRPKTGDAVYADRIKTWNFGVSPPAKYPDVLVLPRVGGTGGTAVFYAAAAVIALRGQPVGSAIRNRLNGRIYHPVGSANVTFPGGGVDGGSQAALIAVYHNLRDRLDPGAHADVGDWVVPSFFFARAVRAVPVITPVDHVLVRSSIGFQVSRSGNQLPYARGA